MSDRGSRYWRNYWDSHYVNMGKLKNHTFWGVTIPDDSKTEQFARYVAEVNAPDGWTFVYEDAGSKSDHCGMRVLAGQHQPPPDSKKSEGEPQPRPYERKLHHQPINLSSFIMVFITPACIISSRAMRVRMEKTCLSPDCRASVMYAEYAFCSPLRSPTSAVARSSA